MAQEEARLSLIATLGTNRVIGRDSTLPWHLPGDLARFKALTLGHPVIMGRRTWESLPEAVRPLLGRTNIVVTRSGWYEAEGALVVHSFPEALSYARDANGAEEIFVIGGQEVFECALPFATRLYLTLIEDSAEGDAYFPAYDEFTREIAREIHPEHTPSYQYLTLER
jgi:dihydrofolate reductase